MANDRRSKYVVQPDAEATEDDTTTFHCATNNTVTQKASTAPSAARRGAASPETGFDSRPRLSSEDVAFQDDDDNDDDINITFQTSDASLLVSSKSSKKPPTNAAVHDAASQGAACHVAPGLVGVAFAADDDEWTEVEMVGAGGDAGVAVSALDALRSGDRADGRVARLADAKTSYLATLQHFRGAVTPVEQRGQLTDDPPDAGACGCFGTCLSALGLGAAPLLSADAARGRDFLFGLAATPLDDAANHAAILKTLHAHFRPRDHALFSAVPRYGAHWEQIGFQGNDPATDLRGVGLLGLLCLLNWFSSAAKEKLALEMFSLSQDAVQNFPFCAMSLNVTRVCLQVLRSGKLSAQVRRRSGQAKGGTKDDDLFRSDADVTVDVFVTFYCAVFHRLCVIWREGHKTICDSGFVLKELEKAAAKKPGSIIQDFESLLHHQHGETTRRRTRTKPEVTKKETKTTKDRGQQREKQFTNLEDL